MPELLLFILLSASAFAQNYDYPSQNYDSSATISTDTFVVPVSVYAIVVMLFGLYLTFSGLRMIRTTLFVMGFLLFTILGILYLPQLHLLQSHASDTVVLLASLGLGLLGGFIAMYLVSFGLFVLGALAGFSLGMIILALHPVAFLETFTGRAVLIIVFVIAGVVLMFYLQKPAIIISTSMIGSFIFFNGLDVFAHVGYISHTRAFFKGQIELSRASVAANPNLYAVIAGVPVLALIGMFVQFLINRNHERGTRNKTALPK
jgi:hypothetical protein